MKFLSCVSVAAIAVVMGQGTAWAQSAANINAANLINSFSLLGQSAEGRAVLDRNLATAIGTNNGSTDAQRAQALRDNTIASLVGSMNNGLSIADGLGTKMYGVFGTKNTVSQNYSSTALSPSFQALFSQVNALTVNSDSAFSKNFFANGSTDGVPGHSAVGIKLPPGGAFNVYDTAYAPSPANANTVGNSRPVQVAPGRIQTFSGTDFFGVPVNSATDIVPTLKGNASFPSGHSAYGLVSSMLMATMAPERYRELLTRGSEFGNSRVVLGAHYPLDVIGARIQSTYALAKILNNDPEYLSKTVPGLLGGTMTTTSDFAGLYSSATADLRGLLGQGCGTQDLSACAATGTADRFSNAAQNKADYTYRLTYGLPPVGPTNLAPVVPEGAEILIASRFPYLNAMQRREVLATTELPSGVPLDDGSGWARLNLYAAAGGYGAFNSNVTVTMDASKGGFNANDTWDNDISGTGGLTKAGTGVLHLAGANTYSGATNILGGALVVDGSIGNSAVNVGPTGMLAGNGRVGGLAVQGGGILSPGNSIGTLTVAGNASFAPGSIYLVEANAAGQSDRTVVGGSTSIQGGQVQVLAESGHYRPQTTYNILNSAGGVSGRFAGVSSNLAFLNPYLSYDASNVNLTLARNDVAFASVAATGNQASAATAAQSLGFGNRVYDAVAVLDAANARRAFTALSGEIHASTVSSEFETGYIVRESILGRLRGSFEATVSGLPGFAPGATLPAGYAADLPRGRRPALAPVPVGPSLDPRVISVWGQGFGSFGSTRSNGNAGSIDREVGGFTAGIDATLEGNYRIGVAGGYTQTSVKANSKTSSADVTSGFGAIYAGANFGALSLRAGGVFAGNSTETRRSVNFQGFSDSLRGRADGTTLQGFGEVGYRIDTGFGTILEPFVGGAIMSISRDAFTERGGSAALKVLGRDYDIETLTAGLRGEMTFGPNSPFAIRGMVGYRGAFGDVLPVALSSFAAGGSVFSSAGVPIDRSAFVAEAGLSWKISPATTLGVSYSGQIGRRAEDHGVRGNFVYRF